MMYSGAISKVKERTKHVEEIEKRLKLRSPLGGLREHDAGARDQKEDLLPA
jgi:hypothetical protein